MKQYFLENHGDCGKETWWWQKTKGWLWGYNWDFLGKGKVNTIPSNNPVHIRAEVICGNCRGREEFTIELDGSVSREVDNLSSAK